MLGLNPVLSVYVVWDPDFAIGGEIARALFDHYSRTAVTEAGGGVGIDGYYRSAPGRSGGDLPDPIPTSPQACTAIVVLVDENMVRRRGLWGPYLDQVCAAVQTMPHRNRVLPVA